jgi:hypothetical protein
MQFSGSAEAGQTDVTWGAVEQARAGLRWGGGRGVGGRASTADGPLHDSPWLMGAHRVAINFAIHA